MDPYKFERDLTILAQKACNRGNGGRTNYKEVSSRLDEIKKQLLELYKRNLVKINHSAMELLCTKSLIEQRYEVVAIEHVLNENLICDVYGSKTDSHDGRIASNGFPAHNKSEIIVEIETGFISPEYALEPSTYNRARISSKISRYSPFATKFVLGTPTSNILFIPEIFLEPPDQRREDCVRAIKSLCDLYYKNPPVMTDEIRNARLDSVYIIDVDQAQVRELKPSVYIESIRRLKFISD